MFQVIRRDYSLKLSDNKYLIGAIMFAASTHLAILYTPLSNVFQTVPLGLHHWAQVAAVLGVFLVLEYGYRRMLSRRYGDRVEAKV
jgi:hypothetical protein